MFRFFQAFLAVLISTTLVYAHDLPLGDAHEHGVARAHFHRVDTSYNTDAEPSFRTPVRILWDMSEKTVGQDLTDDNKNLILHLWDYHGMDTDEVMAWLIGWNRPEKHHNQHGNADYRGNKHTTKQGQKGKHVHVAKIKIEHPGSDIHGGGGSDHGHNIYEKADGNWTWHGIFRLEYTATHGAGAPTLIKSKVESKSKVSKGGKIAVTWASLKKR